MCYQTLGTSSVQKRTLGSTISQKYERGRASIGWAQRRVRRRHLMLQLPRLPCYVCGRGMPLARAPAEHPQRSWMWLAAAGIAGSGTASAASTFRVCTYRVCISLAALEQCKSSRPSLRTLLACCTNNIYAFMVHAKKCNNANLA